MDLSRFIALAPARAAAIVAIPACNEASRIEACLAALAMQRDPCGAPLPPGALQILVYANNCNDGTVAVVRAFAETAPHRIEVVAATHPPERANAGWARKSAMDLAADRLDDAGLTDGIILTTDADSIVSPTWVAANLAELGRPVECVAGYIDALPAEIMRLGPQFIARGRLEDRYLRLAAEIYARCDPRPHDPWPNHRVSSGASLAVTLPAYRAVGGLPAIALGEDGAFTRALEAAGLRVRRSMDVSVATSCRFDGRAKGGAADTMRLRHEQADAPCDDDIEPALRLLWRALMRGALRHAHAAETLDRSVWTRRLGLGEAAWSIILDQCAAAPFDTLWQRVTAEAPTLTSYRTLRPSDLPPEIVRLEAILRRLRAKPFRAPQAAPGDKPLRTPSPVSEIA